ncbi:MAG: hypothetical protein RLY20_1542 [Verrucomicrobiota bacterium]|jgi:hypothetical protein
MLPREIVTEHDPEWSRFDLPPRQLGPLRFIGLVPMLFAVGFAWMPGKQLVHSVTEIIAGSGSGFNWFLVVFLSVFVVAALMPFGFGLFLFAGRTRVVVKKDRIVTTEIAGPFRWSRRWKFAEMDHLEISGATLADGQAQGFIGALCGVTVILKNGRKTPVVAGYPRAWLQPLVAEITSLMQRRGKAVPVEEISALPDREDKTITTEQRAEKPAGSAIELSSTDWSAEFTVPSRGLFKESCGLVGFGAVWCIFVGVIGWFVFGKEGLNEGAIFLLLFFAIGFVMLLTGIHLGTRRWTLRANHAQLHVTLKSALRSREWKWAAGEIADIRVGDSGTKVNERMLEQLQVMTHQGKSKTGLLTGRTHDELAWVATTLRGALGAPAGESPEAPPRIDRSNRHG